MPVVLLVAAAALMLHGALTRRDAAPEPTPTPSPAAKPAGRPDLEKTPLSYFSDYWRQLGSGAAESLALVGQPQTPAIRIAPGYALTSIRALDGLGLAQPTDGPRLLAADAELELALFELRSMERPFEPADPGALHAGALVAAVTLASDGRTRVIPGHLVSGPSPFAAGAGFGTLDVSLPAPAGADVAAIVDLDGKLVGGSFPTRDGARVLSAAALAQIAEQLRTGGACRAVSVATATDDVRALLRLASGVLVEQVLRSSFAAEPALRPGDLLLEWGGHSVETADDFRRLYDAEPVGRAVPVTLLRGGRRLSGTLVMPAKDCRPAVAPSQRLPGAGLALRWTRAGAEGVRAMAGFRVLEVEAGRPAQRAGLVRGDLIVAVDGLEAEPAARAALEAFERRPRPLLLGVRRGERALLLVLGPQGAE